MISQDLSYSVTTLHSFKHEWLSFFEVSHADERQHHNHYVSKMAEKLLYTVEL